MALIFYLSAQPDLGTGLGAWDTVLRKLAHATEYGLLFLLLHRAFRFRNARAAAGIAFAYAISDELHQTTVPTRHGSPVDVLIDTAGIAIAALLAHRMRVRHRARRQAA